MECASSRQLSSRTCQHKFKANFLYFHPTQTPNYTPHFCPSTSFQLLSTSNRCSNHQSIVIQLNGLSNANQPLTTQQLPQLKSLNRSIQPNRCPNQPFSPNSTHPIARRYLISAQFVNCHLIRLSTRPSCNAPAQTSTRTD